MTPRERRDVYLEQLDDNPRLPLAARRELVEALGPLHHSDKFVTINDNLRARVELETQCVRVVLPKWSALWPDDERPADLLRWTQMYLDGTVQARQLQVAAGRLYTIAEEREPRAEWPARVGVAAAGIARVARKGGVIADYADDEQALDIEDWDAGALAVAVVCNVPPWIESEGQRAFWQWYLTEAYERALEVAGLTD